MVKLTYSFPHVWEELAEGIGVSQDVVSGMAGSSDTTPDGSRG